MTDSPTWSDSPPLAFATIEDLVGELIKRKSNDKIILSVNGDVHYHQVSIKDLIDTGVHLIRLGQWNQERLGQGE